MVKVIFALRAPRSLGRSSTWRYPGGVWLLSANRSNSGSHSLATDLTVEYAIVSFTDGYVYDVEEAAVQSTFATPVGDFGFFLDLPGLGTFYSDSAYNPGGVDVFGAFPVIGQPGDYSFTFSVGSTVLAWELMTNIQAVPEPGVIILLGAGLVGLGLSRRRRLGGA